MTHADSTYSQTAYGTASQNCSSSTYGLGYSTLYTDEAGNQRGIFTDALGRVIEADEPTSGSQTPSVPTCYTYDALGNLLSVTQGSSQLPCMSGTTAVSRSFTYDELSRVTSACTPEANGGTRHFYYATSGGALCSGDPSAVCRRTDERAITTTYAYDALNRLTGKTYSDSTPPATFSYDQTSVTIGSWSSGALSNPKGRLTEAVTTSGGNVQTAAVYSYDPMGRPLRTGSVRLTTAAIPASGHRLLPLRLGRGRDQWAHPAGFTITNTISARPAHHADLQFAERLDASADSRPEHHLHALGGAERSSERLCGVELHSNPGDLRLQ